MNKAKNMKWTDELVLDELKKWIDSGNWNGLKHLQKHNGKLYFALHKRMGIEEAFKRLGLDYADYKKTNRKWTEETILSALSEWLEENGWKGAGHLHQQNSKLYEAIYNYMGLETAFEKLGLDYKEYAVVDKHLTENETIDALRTWVNEGKWAGLQHLRRHNTYLYKGLKEVGVEKAFKQLGLDYTVHNPRIKWTNEKIITAFQEYLEKHDWRGTTNFKEEEPHLHAVIYRTIGLEEAFRLLGLNYEDYRVNEQWDETKLLSQLKNWIDNGNWNGTAHFMEKNKRLYNSLYHTMEMDAAFAKIGLDYSQFVIQEGYPRERIEQETLAALKQLIVSGNWQGVNKLKEAHYFLYVSLNRIGLEEAFAKIGFDYKDYKITKEKQEKTPQVKPKERKWTTETILAELRNWIEDGKWESQSHFSEQCSGLYNAIRRDMGMKEAFKMLGYNYYDFKKKRVSKWTEENMLTELREWIDSGKWKSPTHFQKNNGSLYMAIRRKMGIEEAFKKLGINYDDYRN